MNNIEKILNELYIIDPSFKSQEGEIKNIIQELLKSKPEIKIDENFINRLREQLQLSARLRGAGFQGRHSFWEEVFGKRTGLALAGGLVSLFIVLAIMPVFRQFGTTNIPAGDDIVAVDEEKTITKDDKGGIVVKKDDGAGGEKIVAGFLKFESEKEFRDYLALADSNYYGGMGMGGMVTGMAEMGISMDAKTEMSAPASSAEPERFSGTNVQVKGIDEPDIVKTNGKEIYFSSTGYGYYTRPMPMFESNETIVGDMGILPPEYNQPDTKIIKAFPPAGLAEKGAIKKNGNLLLKDNILVVLENNNNSLSGYDVTSPDSPKEKWAINLKDNNSIVQARLYAGKIYLITNTWINRSNPCPMPLFIQDGKTISIPCLDIYHPQIPISSEAVYNISTIDVATGNITKGISFVGSYNSTIYMSQNAVYVAYSYNGDQFELYYDFFKESENLVPAWMMERFTKVKGYDLSQQAKMAEFETIMNEFRRSLSDDDSLKFENEMTNKMSDYVKKHKRDLTKTDIVKINIDDLKVETIGIVPGSLLNQFSLDEYEKNLRVAVTVGENFLWGARIETENDIYVLDKNLKVVGSAQGLGAGERIYSARFIGDKGYLVTFRQTDPFYVLDLSNPNNPQVKGELKIPGYSSYLDPIAENRILGIGKEGSEVKISLFDVSSPTNPQEVSKYILKEYWSDILNTHHAFLSDEKHKIFFLPGSNGGYVFSYENDSLKLQKAVSDMQAKRALFINDYLYIVGENKIVVLNETDWETVNELVF